MVKKNRIIKILTIQKLLQKRKINELKNNLIEIKDGKTYGQKYELVKITTIIKELNF